MARRQGSKTKARQQKPKPRAPRKRRRITSKNISSNPIVSGVRSILSILPSAAMKIVSPLADFVFRGFGLATSVSGSNGQYTGTMALVGLTNALVLRPAQILAFTDRVIRNEASAIPKGATFTSNIASVKTLRYAAKIRNITAASGKRGFWAAAFVEFGSANDYDMWNNRALDYRDVCNLPGSVHSDCCKDLSLSWSPKRDSFAGSAVSPGAAIGYLFIAFENMGRGSFGDFSTDEFGCTLDLSGQFQIVEWMPNNAGMSYSSGVDTAFPTDCAFLTVNTAIADLKAGKYVAVLESCKASSDSTQCEFKASKFVNVTSQAPPKPLHCSLDVMTLD